MLKVCNLTTGQCHTNGPKSKTPKRPVHNCPFCGAGVTFQCRCARSDMKCPNGHSWHRCPVHRKIVMGESDHSQPMNQCTCKHRPGNFSGVRYWFS